MDDRSVERQPVHILGEGGQMRKIRYWVASSLDGYIADADGGTEWIVMDPAIDFAAKLARFDTFLVGRATYEHMVSRGAPSGDGGVSTWVFSRTLRAEDHPDVTVVSDDIAGHLADLRSRPGKEIALFGGGKLFRSLLEVGAVDVVEVALLPVLLGGGVPLLPSPSVRSRLVLESHRVYAETGTVALEYSVATVPVRESSKDQPEAP
jgi:dihydrofolate reductase